MTAAREPIPTDEGKILAGPKIAALSCGKPVFLVVLLHGEGSDGQAVIDHALNWAPTMPKADFLAAEAPFPCPGGVGRQWFESADLTPEAVAKGLAEVGPWLDAFLDARLAERRLDASHLALVGYSQGAALALHAGLRRHKAPASIVAFSGAMPAALPAEVKSHPPLLMIHGEADEVAPYGAMIEAKEHLKALGVPAKSFRRPGLGHETDDDGIIAAGDFLAATVVKKPAPGAEHDHDHDDHDHDHDHDDHDHDAHEHP